MKTRPVRHWTGKIGTCECHENRYVIHWEDGQTVEHIDISYVGAKFTDVGTHPAANREQFKIPRYA